MTKNECFNLGYISRRVGNKGELAFIIDADNPSRYNKLESVFVEINKSLIPFFIKKIVISRNFATVTIDGIDTVDKADEMVGCGLYLPMTALPTLKGKKFYFHELNGFKVFDKNYGEIGVVQNVLDFPQQDIFQIIKDKNEILIPAKEEFITAIDRTKKELHLQAPEGLIDIYIQNKPDEEDEKETDQE